MFGEIFFFLLLCKPAKLCFQSFKTFFTHSHTSFQITIYKVSNLENKLIQWENTDKSESLKNCLCNTIRKNKILQACKSYFSILQNLFL